MMTNKRCDVVWTNEIVCSGSVGVTAYDFESGRPGSNPEWGQICYKAPITAQGLLEPSFLRGSTLGTRAAEHKGCNWGTQVDWWLQPCAVFSNSFSGVNWHICHKKSQFNCMTLSKGSTKDSILYSTNKSYELKKFNWWRLHLINALCGIVKFLNRQVRIVKARRIQIRLKASHLQNI